jgi:hypothetical protein
LREIDARHAGNPQAQGMAGDRSPMRGLANEQWETYHGFLAMGPEPERKRRSFRLDGFP